MSKKDFLNPFTIVFGLLILLSAIGLVFVWVSVPKNNARSGDSSQIQSLLITDVKVPSLKEDDLLRGSRDATILMVEYSDLECPVCRNFHTTAKSVFSQYENQDPNRLAWAYRHYPIETLHRNANALAQSVECTNRVSGSEYAWLLIDKIYAEMPGVVLDRAKEMAKELGVEEVEFNACIDNEETKQAVENEFREGLSGSVKGTPTIFIFNLRTGKSLGIPFGVDEATLKSFIEEIAREDTVPASALPTVPASQ